MLLAIDPGVDTGWSLFDDERRLHACGLGDVRMESILEPGCLDRLLIECPKLRPWGEKNPNAILTLARNAGQWAGRLEAFVKGAEEFILPNDWKGSTPKNISHARTWSKLDPNEQAAVTRAFAQHPGRNGMAPSKRHNVLDAIGIGLFGVGR